ncbi:MAG: hypothetical protein JRF63_10330, partial [Deltaproteobacteria bacterium]|nr:hypothetical protein [Deltaproteobacteria bacterium]
CPSDCTDYCGDDCCSITETYCDCPGDCSIACGDGCCSTGETIASCPADCLVCGDSSCDSGEDYCSCPADCSDTCGDSCCSASENADTCSADCPDTCGDSYCSSTENDCTCPGDCPVSCGDSCCSSGEECTCPADCGDPCGDLVCNCGETETTCPGDCVSCELPSAACNNGSQDRNGCSDARVIGRSDAGDSDGFTISDDTCYDSDDFDDSSSCWDANADHAYRLFMREGESAYIRVETDFDCDWESFYWNATLKIFENSGCESTACTTKVYCEYNDDIHETTYIAPQDGWIIIVVDGSHAFGDEGDYTFDVDLTCNVVGCEC